MRLKFKKLDFLRDRQLQMVFNVLSIIGFVKGGRQLLMGIRYLVIGGASGQKKAGLIKKETPAGQMSNVDWRMTN